MLHLPPPEPAESPDVAGDVAGDAPGEQDALAFGAMESFEEGEEEETLLVEDSPWLPRGKEEPCLPEPDVAELQLFARIHSLNVHRNGGVGFAEAVDITLDACQTARRGPVGTGTPSRRIDWRVISWFCVGSTIVVVLTVLMLLLCRVSIRLLAARQKVLVATGMEAIPDAEPAVATALALQQVHLLSLATLPIETLRNVRDVTLAHRGVWRCLRVTRAMRLDNLMTWLETFDGTALRIANGAAWIRFGPFGDEESIATAGSWYQDYTRGTSQNVWPTAMLYQIASPN